MIEYVLYWETQEMIDDDRPIIIEADRVVKSGVTWYVHGTSHFFPGLRYARIFGDPTGVGLDNTGLVLADSPTVGQCTLPIPSHAVIGGHVATNYLVTNGVLSSLLGGSISGGAVDVAWDDLTGTITISRAGNWEVSFAVSAEWAVGALSPRVEVALWDVTGTPIVTALQSSMRFSGIGDGRFCSASAPLSLADGTLLRLQVQPDQIGTLDVRHFSLSLKRRQ